MESVTVEQIHEDLVSIKKEIEHLRTIVEEEYELADDVIIDIEESKKRSSHAMVSHKEMKKEFGE